MNDWKEAVLEALAILDLEDLKVSEEAIEEVLNNDEALVRKKGDQNNGKSRC